jgi:maleate isomerase
MTARDNWGWQARIGILIVSSEAVPEAEWWAMAPPGVSVHAARVEARAPWARWRADRSGVDLAEDVVRGARQLAALRPVAVVLAHTSSSILGGEGWDAATVAALAAVVGPGITATTNGLDTQAALRAAGVSRPFLVLPAWFGEETLAAGAEYYARAGLAPAGRMRFDPGPGWRDLPPERLYAEGLGIAQQIEPLYAQIRTRCPPEADGVLIAGTGFRCVGILDALERDLARPVISANQASLWHCLRSAGVRATVPGHGRLLAG